LNIIVVNAIVLGKREGLMEREDVFVLSMVVMAILFMLGSFVTAKFLMCQW
jgi:hypothetical protein